MSITKFSNGHLLLDVIESQSLEQVSIPNTVSVVFIVGFKSANTFTIHKKQKVPAVKRPQPFIF